MSLTAVKQRGRRGKGGGRKPPRHGEVAIVGRGLEVEAYLARHRAATARAIERCLADPFLVARDVLTFEQWLETSRCGIPEPPDESGLFPLLYAARDRVLPDLVAQLDFGAGTLVRQWRTCVVAALIRRLDPAAGEDALAHLLRVRWGQYVALGLLENCSGIGRNRQPRPEDRALLLRADARQRVREAFLDPALVAKAVAVATIHGIDADGRSVLPMLDGAITGSAAFVWEWMGKNWPEPALLDRVRAALREDQFAEVRFGVFWALAGIASRGRPEVVAGAVSLIREVLDEQAQGGLGPPLDEHSNRNPRLLAIEALYRANAPEVDEILLDIAGNMREPRAARDAAWVGFLWRQGDQPAFEQLLASQLTPAEVSTVIGLVVIQFQLGEDAHLPEARVETARRALTTLAGRELDSQVTAKLAEAAKQLADTLEYRARLASHAPQDEPLRSLDAAGRLLRVGPHVFGELPNYVQFVQALRRVAGVAFDADAITQEMTGHRMASGGPPFIIRFVLRERLIEFRVQGSSRLEFKTTIGAVNEGLAAVGEAVRLYRFSAWGDEVLLAFLTPGDAKEIVRRTGRRLVHAQPMTARSY